MKTSTFLLGACILLIGPMAPAVAGPCATEIDSLTKLMAARDAGAGPTAGAAGATSGHPPTAAMGAADPSTAASSGAAQSAKPQHPPTATMNEATQGGGPSAQPGGAARAEHPPTAAMNQATQGSAASPQDVQSQTRGGPTATQQAEGARRPASDQLASAQAALEQARSYDRAGQEASCMDAIVRAISSHVSRARANQSCERLHALAGHAAQSRRWRVSGNDMTNYAKLPTWADRDHVYAVVETPRGSRAKLEFDPKLGVFTLAKPLLAGLTYPYDWGFIPSTKAQDGDPLDVLIVHDAATYPGLVLKCKPIGVLEVVQSSKDGNERNDRVFVVPDRSPFEGDLQDIRRLPARAIEELEKFFEATNALESKKLKFQGWRGPAKAIKTIKKVAV